MSAGTDRRVLAAGAVVVALLLLVLVLAARTGGWTTTTVTSPSAPAASSATPVPDPPLPTPPEAGEQPLREVTPVSPVVGYLALGLFVGSMLVAAAVVVGALVAQRHRRLPSLPVRGTGAVEGPGADRVIGDAVEGALAAVEDPAARESVVRAWLLLGEAAAGAGSPARPAETAAEYADRVASELGLPGPPLYRLAELYRVARFSAHPVSEAQRAQARTLLVDLRAGLVSR